MPFYSVFINDVMNKLIVNTPDNEGRRTNIYGENNLMILTPSPLTIILVLIFALNYSAAFYCIANRLYCKHQEFIERSFKFMGATEDKTFKPSMTNIQL